MTAGGPCTCASSRASSRVTRGTRRHPPTHHGRLDLEFCGAAHRGTRGRQRPRRHDRGHWRGAKVQLRWRVVLLCQVGVPHPCLTQIDALRSTTTLASATESRHRRSHGRAHLARRSRRRSHRFGSRLCAASDARYRSSAIKPRRWFRSPRARSGPARTARPYFPMAVPNLPLWKPRDEPTSWGIGPSRRHASTSRRSASTFTIG